MFGEAKVLDFILFRKMPLKAQNDYIFQILGGNDPFGPPWQRLGTVEI